MSIKTKIDMCNVFFEELASALGDQYEVRVGDEKTSELLLCPAIGPSEDDDINSDGCFRVSKYWNWFPNASKNPNPNHIRNYCVDLPGPHERTVGNKSGKPIVAACVCVKKNGKYRVVYGEYFDKKAKVWRWRDNTVEEVLSDLN